MAKGLDSKTVKSAHRVLELLEYIGEEHRSLTVMDISRALQYPQSSTSELLSCLVNRGYLHHDRAKRTFHPTVRVAALGHNVQPSLTRQGVLFDMIDAIHQDCGYPVLLSMIHRSSLHHVYHAGDPRPLSGIAPSSPLHSALGQVLLCNWDVGSVRALVHRLNAEAEAGASVGATAFLDHLEDISRRGYAVTSAQPAFPGRFLSLALPAEQGDNALSLGVAIGECETDASIGELVGRIRGAVSRHLGKELAGIAPAPVLALRA